MPLSSFVVLSLAGLPLGYLIAQHWPTLRRSTGGSGGGAHMQPTTGPARPHDERQGLCASAPGGPETVPLPSEYLARWTIDYDAGDAQVRSRTVRVLRVHHRLMGLMCYCEDTHHIRTFAWDGLRAVREPDSGLPVDFAAWVAASAA
ncbi:MAG TPA: hypothetical protein PKC59_03650 [Burkholderiaceae bacterium]|nr:hypothetical protein [Burkholderiaceae bacterium]